MRKRSFGDWIVATRSWSFFGFGDSYSRGWRRLSGAPPGKGKAQWVNLGSNTGMFDFDRNRPGCAKLTAKIMSYYIRVNLS